MEPGTLASATQDESRLSATKFENEADELVEKDGVEVLVQPCERRVFTANDFLKVCPRSLPSTVTGTNHPIC